MDLVLSSPAFPAFLAIIFLYLSSDFPSSSVLAHLGCLLGLRCRVGPGRDGVDDESVREPEVLQAVLQSVALECDGPLLARQHLEPAPRVSPELSQVEVQTELHPGQVDAGDGDQADLHPDLHLFLLSLPVLG